MQEEPTSDPIPGARAAKIAIMNAQAVIKVAADLNEVMLMASHSLSEPARSAFKRALNLSIDKMDEAQVELDGARKLEAWAHAD